jgi:hypothetical protein
MEENHTITKKTRTVFLAACCKISSVAQYLVVVTVCPSSRKCISNTPEFQKNAGTLLADGET